MSPIPTGPFPAWDVRKVIDAWKYPSDDLISVCAHRGASHDGGTENSYSSIARAAKEGWESIEIDIRLSKDGKVVLFHDEGLGRLTDIAPPDGMQAYNPFTGQGYHPPFGDFTWEEIRKLRLKDGYGRPSDERVISLEEALAFVRDQKIDIVLQFDLKQEAVIGPSLDIINSYENADGIPATSWCIYKLRTDWIPTPAVWERQPYIRKIISTGTPFPLVTPFYEVDVGQPIEDMAAWAEASYFVAYEIALERPGGSFQRCVDFVHSSKSKMKGHGGWYRGNSLPRDYWTGVKTVWDDSTCSEAALREGIDAALAFHEGRGLLKPGGVPLGTQSAQPDERVSLEFAISVGLSYLIADTETDVPGRLAKMGKRNVARMMK